MLTFGTLINSLVQRTAPEDQNQTLIRLVESAVADIDAAPSSALLPSMPPVLVDLAVGTEPYLAVLDESGQVLYSSGQANGAPPVVPAAVVVEALQQGKSSAIFTTTAGIELNVHARSWQRSDLGLSGVAVAGQSTEFVVEQLRGLSALFWIVGIIMTVASSVVGWLIAGRALRPLRQLATTTDEIRETGDLSGRLPPARNGKDEVGVLTASFNSMLEGLQSTRHDLSESLASQRRFVADASHELRSPLTTIRNNAEFLAQRPEASESDRNEALEDIVAEAKRMSGLIGDLLILAHGDAGPEMERHPVDLSALVSELVRRRQGVELHSVGPVVVMGDEADLSRLLMILLDNAAKHGGGETTVSVSTDGDRASLSVGDNGPGIHPEHIGRLFERFYRADPARTASGYGLGLAIANEIVTAHGGTIAAVNRPDGGAMFTADFPTA